MDNVQKTTSTEVDPEFPGIYSQHDLIVDGIAAVAGLAVFFCVLVAWVKGF